MSLRPLPILALLASICAAECDLGLAQTARRALDQRDYTAAEADFRRAIAACPQQPALRLELAQALTAQRKLEDASRAAREFLALEPRSEPGLLVLANVQLMAQHFEEARKTAGQALAVNPRSVGGWKLLANIHYLSGEDREAEAAFLRAIEIDPDNEDAIYSLGRIYYQQNRFEAARARFQRVLALNAKSYKAYDNLALCYEALGNEQEAIRHYLKALDLVHKDHPEYEWPYANLANLLLKRGENEQAFQLASEAASRNPSSARNFFLTGKALARLEKPELAVKWLRQSIELDPAYPEPRYLLGQVYQKLGRKEEAQQQFQAFQEIHAKTPRRKR